WAGLDVTSGSISLQTMQTANLFGSRRVVDQKVHSDELHGQSRIQGRRRQDRLRDLGGLSGLELDGRGRLMLAPLFLRRISAPDSCASCAYFLPSARLARGIRAGFSAASKSQRRNAVG